MAKLTSEQETGIRNFVERKANGVATPITWLKTEINAAAQAVEDVTRGVKKIGAGKELKKVSDIMDDEIEVAASGIFDATAKEWIREAVQTVVGVV